MNVARLLSLLWLGSFVFCSGQDDGAKLGVWSDQVSKDWWSANTNPQQWLAESERINVTLRKAHEKHGLGRMINNNHWMGWMLHTRWLRFFPKNWETHEFFKEEENRRIWVAVQRNQKVRELFLSSLVPEDDELAAMTVLCRIAKSNPKDLLEFSGLAVAFAVVHDQAVPKSWPHAFVDQAKVPVGNADPVERFAFYVKCQREKKLMHDLRRLAVRDLTFLVDTPVELRELAYAQQINLRGPGQLADLYRAVPYNMSRINSQNYIWPDAEYRLVEIGKKGGICMDQAYFVSHSGKAKGVPTLLFVGQGLSGDHAWVGYLDERERWNMDVAKFRGEKYPIGQAYDPQTWQRITDTEIAALTQGLGSNSGFSTGHKLMQWAMMNKGNELYAEILRAARISMAQDPRPWRLEADWLDESEASFDDKARFWSEWTRHFARNTDLLVKGQMRLIGLLEEKGDQARADRLRAEVMGRNKSKRFDLGIAIAAEPVFRKLRKQDWDGAEKALDTAMRRFKSQAGGHLFYNLLQPYIQTCVLEGQVARAKDAVKYFREFNVVAGTILDNDMAEMRRLVEGR